MAASDLLIAQITDTHLGGAANEGVEDNFARLDRVLERLCTMTRVPDLLLVTGDLADNGGIEAYRALAERLDSLPFPARVALGNHDDRETARSVFDYGEDDYLHYTIDMGEVAVVMLDTLEQDRHGGAFCVERQAWLRDTLRHLSGRPVLVALHHPPIDTGLDWMTTAPGEPWVARLEAALSEASEIVALLCGHIHRPIASALGPIPVRVCPAVSATLGLDLGPLSPDSPDDRPLVVEGPPGYALHLWRAGVLTSHFAVLEPGPERVLLKFDQSAQPFVRTLFAERQR